MSDITEFSYGHWLNPNLDTSPPLRPEEDESNVIQPETPTEPTPFSFIFTSWLGVDHDDKPFILRPGVNSNEALHNLMLQTPTNNNLM